MSTFTVARGIQRDMASGMARNKVICRTQVLKLIIKIIDLFGRVLVLQGCLTTTNHQSYHSFKTLKQKYRQVWVQHQQLQLKNRIIASRYLTIKQMTNKKRQ
jgi:hypothetical protein